MNNHNSPDRPDYKHPDYVKTEEMLCLLKDTFEGLYQRKDRYLARAESEPDRAYRERVNRAVFNNKLTPALQANAGLLTAFELSDLPESLEAALDNVDGTGSDLKTFLQEADIIAQRDGHCFILVDSPTEDRERTAADRIENPIRPYLHLIDRRDVLNWKLSHTGGQATLEQVTIQFVEPVPSGRFGIKGERRYHVFSRQPNGVLHETMAIDQDTGEVSIIASNVAPISQIPLLCYPFTARPFGTDCPPFLKTAELNIKLFRKESALDEIEYRTNCPTVWRRSSEPLSDRGPVVFGSTWVIELFDEDEVGVLEIGGSSIDKLQESIDQLKKDIDKNTGAFLSNSGQVARTATEMALSAMTVSSSLTGYARAKASAIIELADLWVQFTGEDNNTDVQQDVSVMEVPLEAQEIKALLELYVSDVISRETLLDLLRMGRQLPPNFDVAEELERLEAERRSDIDVGRNAGADTDTSLSETADF